jgi:hypothetical protein
MLCLSAFFLSEWVQDFSFYKENNWDFSKESGRNYFYVGEFASEPEAAAFRVKFGFPFAVLVALLVGIYFTFFFQQ